MKKILLLFSFLLICFYTSVLAENAEKPWKNGNLKVTSNKRYLQHKNGKLFFMLANTAWLMPERANREEAKYLLEESSKQGYNVVMVQAIGSMPSINAYGQMSNPDGWNFDSVDKKGTYGYWDHMDYIVHEAENQGIYIAMACVWGNVVKDGNMTSDDAVKYGTFLANRYKDCPNIIWIIGGDIDGNVKEEVWNTLATTIKAIDTNHLMTFHPSSHTTSASWFSKASWIDFHMLQSANNVADKRKSGKAASDDNLTDEDNWKYIENAQSLDATRPVLDGEPPYEDAKQPSAQTKPDDNPHINDGFSHVYNNQDANSNEDLRYIDCDIRRQAYWSVFAGSCGHTYGHNAIAQFLKPGYSATNGDTGNTTTWYQGMKDPAFSQMKYLKNLMLRFPLKDCVPDQTVISGTMGKQQHRLIALRGSNYLLVYNYTGRRMNIDMRKISGPTKKVFWMDAKTGYLSYIGTVESKIQSFNIRVPDAGIHDGVLIAFDSYRNYLDSMPSIDEWNAIMHMNNK